MSTAIVAPLGHGSQPISRVLNTARPTKFEQRSQIPIDWQVVMITLGGRRKTDISTN
jgi:hypothetical protein